MTKIMTKIWLIALLLSAPHLCRAQGYATVIVSLHANSLSGVVVDPEGGTFPNISVYRIECGKGKFSGVVDPVILQQVQTDVKGNFAFPWKDHNRTCLKVQTQGMDPLQAEVKYARSGGKLKLILHVAN
jgi:hypothetical protein